MMARKLKLQLHACAFDAVLRNMAKLSGVEDKPPHG